MAKQRDQLLYVISIPHRTLPRITEPQTKRKLELYRLHDKRKRSMFQPQAFFSIMPWRSLLCCLCQPVLQYSQVFWLYISELHACSDVRLRVDDPPLGVENTGFLRPDLQQ